MSSRLRVLVPLAVVGGGAALLAAARRRRAPAPMEDARVDRAVPGRPRFVLPAGSAQGTVAHGSPAASGVEQQVPLRAGRTVVGRGHEADLRLTDPTVSPVHAEVLVRDDGRVLLRDLETENGLRVDGRPVVEAPLVDGNRVQLGDAVLLFQQDLEPTQGREGGEFG